MVAESIVDDSRSVDDSLPHLDILPLSALKSSSNCNVEVELKNGEILIGSLITADTWMNLFMARVQRISSDGSHFWSLKECCIRGSSISSLRLDSSCIQLSVAQNAAREKYRKTKLAQNLSL